MEVITTKDGSSTLFVPSLNETYHSIHGAVTEAQHVFIKNGLLRFNHLPKIEILEIGFGTGLNAYLTALETEQLESSKINYTSLELYPINSAILDQLTFVQDEKKDALFKAMHQVGWNHFHPITPLFNLKKIASSIHIWSTNQKFDLVFFDAFAPNKQPDMWTETVFAKLFNLLNEGGNLVTYCAKGSFKRTLKSVGFKVLTLQGPPGKREMTIGQKLTP